MKLSQIYSYILVLFLVAVGHRSEAQLPVLGQTAKFIPVYRGNLVITTVNSQLYDDGTNAGINTTSPNFKWDVNGTGRYTGPLTIGAYTLPNTDGLNLQVLKTNGAGTVTWQFENWLLQNNNLTNNNTGNVGIGTTTPAYKLDVTGTGNFTGALKIGAYTLPNTDGTALQVLKTNGSGAAAWQFENWLLSNNNLLNNNSGNVGIGTTTPSFKLDVTGNGRFTGPFTIGAYTLPAADGAALQVLKTNGSGAIAWQYENWILNGTNITSNSTGNVGIGTTAPAYKLDVTGTAHFTGPVKVGAYSLPTADGAAGQFQKTDGAGNLSWQSEVPYTAGNAIDISNFVITNTLPDKIVSITGAGAVSATGTYPNFNISSPIVTLTGSGASAISGSFPTFNVNTPVTTLAGSGASSVSGSFPDFTVNTPVTTLGGTGVSTVTGSFPNFIVNTPDPGFSTDGTNVFMNKSGNVGIGVVTPTYKLDVNGDINMSEGHTIYQAGKPLIKTGTGSGLFMGEGAGANVTNGTNNNFFGSHAGNLTTSGSNNSFFGSQAGAGNTTGDDNLSFGYSSSANNSDGNGNTSVGVQSTERATTGSRNTAVGMLSGVDNAGNENTFIGYDTQDNNSSPIAVNNATALGSKAKVLGNNSTAIGANALVTQDNSIVLGNNAKVGIGISAPLFSLDVHGNGQFTQALKVGAYTLPNVDGANGQVLKTDGSGILAWRDAITAGTGISLTGSTVSVSLTGGPGISVAGNTISSTFTGGTGINITGNTINTDLTAGNGINISGSTISSALVAGNGIGISGNTISSALVAGSGIGISGNTISSTITSPWTIAGDDIFNSNTGKLGIGTQSPAERLHIVGNELLDGKLAIGTTIRPELALNLHGNSNFEGNMYIADPNDGHTDPTLVAVGFLYGTGTKRLGVDGRIGIGTLDPQTNLDVRGNSIMTQSSSSSPVLTLNQYDDNAPALLLSNGQDKGAGLRIQAGVKGHNYYMLDVADNAGNSYLRVSGTNGVTYAREVQVTLGTFPDYVFEKDYKLRSLSELENFINANKHLPNIPSAKEVDENQGVKLGELNVKMLEKIEELSLYLIEQNKKLEAQNKLLEAQQQEIEAMKAKMKNN